LNTVERARIRLVLVMATLLLAAGAGYYIETRPPSYAESATVEFAIPEGRNAPNAYYMLAPSLITTGEVMVQIMMSPAAQRQIEAASPSARVSLALVNMYNEDYPYYGVPLATLTATSPVPAETHRTFAASARELGRLIAAWQEREGVPPRERIPARILGDGGPVVQSGSRVRVLGGLTALAALTASLAWNGAGRPSSVSSSSTRTPRARGVRT
jgi:hypothetical protein